MNIRNRTFNRRGNGRFHLHCFRNDKRLTLLYFLALRDKDIDNRPGKGRAYVARLGRVSFFLRNGSHIHALVLYADFAFGTVKHERNCTNAVIIGIADVD